MVNPYAEQLTYGDDRLQARRDQLKYLNLIRSVAFLRQMQRPIRSWVTVNSTREYVEVELSDIEVANELMIELVGHTLGELSRPSYELLGLLEKIGQREPKVESFTRREIREFTGWSYDRVQRYLRELVQFEYVLIENGHNGLPHRYRLMYEGQGKDGQKFLLGLKSIDQLRTLQPLG